MATTRLRTWEITDEFWAKVETYIPNDLRCPGVNYRRKPGGGRKSRYGVTGHLKMHHLWAPQNAPPVLFNKLLL